MGDGLALPSPAEIRAHVVASLGATWADHAADVEALPIQRITVPPITGPLRLVEVPLPEWAVAVGVDGVLLVPAETAGSWETVDWWTAAFLLLECWHERAWERTHGPVHSYSNRLVGWDERVWQRAWVNRIASFLGMWANAPRTRPSAAILLSHDVDAVSKTIPIRIKQGAMRAAVRWRGHRARQGHGGVRFAFGRDEWNFVEEVLSLERSHGIAAKFHVFADPRRRSPMRWLMDPGYRLDRSEGRALLDTLRASDATVGLHPSFDSWNDPHLLAAQRGWLERQLGRPVRSVRQHWLRFSWAETWAAQTAAGLGHDSTLMFNDRAGFRNAAAVTWTPWDHVRSAPHGIEATPCCFMDSHRYDYAGLAAGAPRITSGDVIAECREVGGAVELLWHPHSLSDDYGWRPGFLELVEELV